MSRGDWMRVSCSRRCPICHKADWCLLARDGTAAICARIESKKRCGGAGFLHRLRDNESERREAAGRRIIIPLIQAEPRDCAALAERYRTAVNPIDLIRLAAQLGVSTNALLDLAIGWDGAAWTFPMFSPRRDVTSTIDNTMVGVMNNAADTAAEASVRTHVVGIRRRFPNGRKLSVKGGREGVFLPSSFNRADPDAPVLLPEGPTDTAAALTLGFAAIGRPSCSGGVQALAKLLPGQHVVVVSDADEPGRRGALELARVLASYCRTVKVIEPPAGIKDLRAWLRRGATRGDVLAAIETAEPVRLRVRTLSQ